MQDEQRPTQRMRSERRGGAPGKRGLGRDAEQVRRVLVARADHLGDLVLFSGALGRIRRLYPQARITLSTLERWHAYVEHCPHIDRWLPWERLEQEVLLSRETGSLFGQRMPRSLERFARQARFRLGAPRELFPDVLILPMRSPTGGPRGTHRIAEGLAARLRFGIEGDWANQTEEEDLAARSLYSARLFVPPEARWKHELDVTGDFLRAMGDETLCGAPAPEFWSTSEDREWALGAIRRSYGRVTLALCPGAAGRERVMPPEFWAAVIAAVPEPELDLHIFGSAGERGLCAEIATMVRILANVKRVEDWSGGTSLRQLGECLRLATVVLAPESGPLHLAISLGRPTVGVVGGGHYGRFLPWGNPAINRIVCQRMECFGCGWRCHHPTIRCIEEVRPDAVAGETRGLIRRAGDS